MGVVIASVAGLLIAYGLLLDVLSLARGIRRMRGNGPSGIPVVPLAFYFLACNLLAAASVTTFVAAATLFLALLVIHVLCQFVILLVLDLLLP